MSFCVDEIVNLREVFDIRSDASHKDAISIGVTDDINCHEKGLRKRRFIICTNQKEALLTQFMLK